MVRKLEDYRAFALRSDGEGAQYILELADEVERLRQIVSGKRLPSLYGKKEVADELEIDPKNMHHKMRTKDFPAPNGKVGGRLVWIKESILTYKQQLTAKKGSY